MTVIPLLSLMFHLAAAPAFPDAPSEGAGDPQENARRFPDLYGDWCYRPPSAPAVEREGTMCDASTSQSSPCCSPRAATPENR